MITLGDYNLDWPGCMDQEPPPGSKAYRTRHLTEQLAMRILSRGVSQLVRGVTCNFTNKPEKTSKVEMVTTTSDHKYIQVTRFAKGLKIKPRYVVRSYKEFDENEFKAEIRKVSWFSLYMCEDVNIAAELLANKINTVLDRMAPIRKIQTRNKFAAWISEETKELLEDRRSLQEAAVQSQNEEDWNSYSTDS